MKPHTAHRSPNTLRVTLAQLNFTVGDLDGNVELMLKAREQAVAEGADLILFSELSITGYPPEDLVLRRSFQKAAAEKLREMMEVTADGKTAMLVAAPWAEEKKLYNAIFLLADGKIQHKQFKHDLPNYGVFDEKRVFDAGMLPEPVEFNDVKLGFMVCEDMWNMKMGSALKEADILISINASPFEVGKHAKRLNRACENIDKTEKPLIYLNQICGQDDLVFDGDSFVLSKEKELLLRLSRTGEEIVTTTWHKKRGGWQCEPGTIREYNPAEQVMYQALVLGLKDYVTKNNFPGVIIGLSGGVDSALVAAVAVDALGKDKVRLVMMPSQFTSEESITDALALAENLGVTLEQISIEPMIKVYTEVLAEQFRGTAPGITEENLQSRIRGNILMAFSNKFGHMVIATGNKSEMSVGYATLYGDMAGGYALLKDVYKMQVYALSQWRNSAVPENGLGPEGKIIPDNIIMKAPTAELKANQRDEDTLPPYEILDEILTKMVEQELSRDDIVEAGYERSVVEEVFRMLHMAEYKRRQSAPGPKISAKPFSRDRRYPITNKFGS